MQINAYLGYNGNCEEAFKFYEQALGGKIESMVPYETTPMAEKMSPEWRKKIAHAKLVANGQVLMGGDMAHDCYQAPKGITVCINPATTEEAERVFKALSQDGNVTMPIQETFWAVRFGMFTDRFGIPWMVNYQKAFQSAGTSAA